MTTSELLLCWAAKPSPVPIPVRLSERCTRSASTPWLRGCRRPDCVAEVVGFELRNVVLNYPFDKSRRFAGIQPNSGHGDYARLSYGVGDAQLGPSCHALSSRSCAGIRHRGASLRRQ